MNIEQMKARLAELSKVLSKYENLETMTQEDIDSVNALNEEVNSLTSQIEAKEKIQAMSATLNSSTRKTSPSPIVEVRASRIDKLGGFDNAGEFFKAVKNAARGTVDPRFNNSTHFERNGEDGGFLVPHEIMTDVTKKLQGDESLFAKTRNFSVSGNGLTLPTDETSPWSGGIQAYWSAEGEQGIASKHKFGQASWKLNKLFALVKITDELAEDAVALESYIRALAPEAITHKLNSAILSGTGAGQPMGILNSPFKIVAPKESGQTADTINARNVIKMYSRMIPSARAGAVWYINAGCEEQLRTMKDDLGNFIYLSPGSQMNQTPYGMLLGLPVVPMLGSMPQLGDEGDIVLANLNYYYTISKVGGLKSDLSTHLYFDLAINAYRFIFRVDGSCPFKAPVKTEFGNHEMSAFITLEAR